MRTWLAVALLPVALAVPAYWLDAAATIVNADEFAVVRNGTTIFDDSFNRNITLNGGSGPLGFPRERPSPMAPRQPTSSRARSLKPQRTTARHSSIPRTAS